MKRKIIFIISLLIILMPIKSYGLSYNVSISCDKNEIQQNESVNCILKGSTDVSVSGIDAMLSSDPSLEISNKIVCKSENSETSDKNICEGNWSSFGEKIDNHIELLTEDDITNSFDIISFNIVSSIPGTYKIYLKDISFVGGVEDDFAEHSVSDYELPIIVIAKQQGESNDLDGTKQSSDEASDDNSDGGEVITDVPNTQKNINIYIYVVLTIITFIIGLTTYLYLLKAKKRSI